MTEFGFGDYSGGFQRPPPRQQGSSRPFLYFLLILTCTILGVFLAWGIREHGERTRLSVRNQRVEDAYVVVLATRNDQVSFLTDPRTRLYRLSGHNHATGQNLTIAWQQETRKGLLVADQLPVLPGDEYYTIWRAAAGAQPIYCASFRPEPGGTFYGFGLHDPLPESNGFLVTLETSRRPDKPGTIVYQTQ